MVGLKFHYALIVLTYLLVLMFKLFALRKDATAFYFEELFLLNTVNIQLTGMLRVRVKHLRVIANLSFLSKYLLAKHDKKNFNIIFLNIIGLD